MLAASEAQRSIWMPPIWMPRHMCEPPICISASGPAGHVAAVVVGVSVALRLGRCRAFLWCVSAGCARPAGKSGRGRGVFAARSPQPVTARLPSVLRARIPSASPLGLRRGLMCRFELLSVVLTLFQKGSSRKSSARRSSSPPRPTCSTKSSSRSPDTLPPSSIPTKPTRPT